KKYYFNLIQSIFIIDIIIVQSGLIVIGPLHVMYTIVNLFVGKKASDLIMDGLDPRKAVSIISNKVDFIADEIIKNMKVSATVFDGHGGYLKKNRDMTYLIVNKYQLMRIKKIINSVDDSAFVVVHDVREVSGGSFAWEPLVKEKKKKKANSQQKLKV